mmetsp:Transcript_16332/g.36686  ORF Transcript_16332/g.36686 Transcript_16332/m.36686 type:complete len:85 (+) Transcript_16332:431-685(+)
MHHQVRTCHAWTSTDALLTVEQNALQHVRILVLLYEIDSSEEVLLQSIISGVVFESDVAMLDATTTCRFACSNAEHPNDMALVK